MSDQDAVALPPMPGHREPRRWPSIVVAVALVSALALTGMLAFQDRQNADAASSARVNAARDAVAFESLTRVARSIDLAETLQRSGVVGLLGIATGDFQSLVSGLGGALMPSPDQWTLALGGGWACMTWPPASTLAAPSVARGVCGGVPIVRSPSVSPAALAGAELRSERQQRAAVDGAFVAATGALASTTGPRRFSMASLSGDFQRLGHVGFRDKLSSSGMTVLSSTSEACLTPSPSAQSVVVVLGPCT